MQQGRAFLFAQKFKIKNYLKNYLREIEKWQRILFFHLSL